METSSWLNAAESGLVDDLSGTLLTVSGNVIHYLEGWSTYKIIRTGSQLALKEYPYQSGQDQHDLEHLRISAEGYRSYSGTHRLLEFVMTTWPQVSQPSQQHRWPQRDRWILDIVNPRPVRHILSF